ncbi:MAG TPA: nitrate reductase [Gammaproteobacteria bacterium]
MFLNFVQGPLWYASLAIFVVGVLWRLYEIFARGTRTDLATPRAGGTAGALRTVFSRSWTAPGFSRGAVFHLVGGYMFHLGLFVLLFFAAPHVVFIEERILGFGWTPAPHWLFILAADLAFAGLVLLWLRRMMHPVMRRISTFDDHAAAILTFAVLFTGCMALLESHDGLRALHMLTVCLLLIYFPFSRLMHAFTFVISRSYTGAVMARKGVQA